MKTVLLLLLATIFNSCSGDKAVTGIQGTNFIKGTVLHADNSAYSNASVFLLKQTEAILAKTKKTEILVYTKIDSTYTDTQGVYHFDTQEDGIYRIDVYSEKNELITKTIPFECKRESSKELENIIIAQEVTPIDTTTATESVSRIITITGEANISETQVIATQDTVPIGGSSWANYNYGAQSIFTTGVYDYNTRLRSLFKFAFEDSITSEMTIDSAFIVLTISEWLGLYTENDVTLNTHILLQNWDEGNLAQEKVSVSSNGATSTERVYGTPWNARCIGIDDVDAQRDTSSTTIIPYGVTEVRISIADAIASWRSGVANNGIVIVNENELETGRSKLPVFHSSECDSTGVPPRVEIYIKTKK